MAKKKVAAVVKIQIEAGKASPAPPVGTALGPHGIAIMDFVKAYNARTEAQAGTVVPTEITIYEDRTFDFILKTPPAAVLIRKAAGLDKAANNPGSETVGTITEAQVEEIAKIKMPDLNANDIEAAKQQIRGTARSHGHRRRLTPTCRLRARRLRRRQSAVRPRPDRCSDERSHRKRARHHQTTTRPRRTSPGESQHRGRQHNVR